MPFPNPYRHDKWQTWADEFTKEITRMIRDPASEFNSPRPVALSHMGDNPGSNLGIERATTDAILLYDPQTDTVRISIGGAWWYLVPVATFP